MYLMVWDVLNVLNMYSMVYDVLKLFTHYIRINTNEPDLRWGKSIETGVRFLLGRQRYIYHWNVCAGLSLFTHKFAIAPDCIKTFLSQSKRDALPNTSKAPLTRTPALIIHSDVICRVQVLVNKSESYSLVAFIKPIIDVITFKCVEITVCVSLPILV